jgi:hypothetical protein
MIPRIISYKIGSQSARLLSQSLDCPRIRPDGNYSYNHNHLIINLGFSGNPNWANQNVRWLNKPASVNIVVCKKKTFLKLKEANVSIPDFTEDKNVAIEWINQGHKVACREILNGHSADGLVVAHSVNELSPQTKLYVKYFPKKHEYRVHMIRDKDGVKIFDFIQKKVRSNLDHEPNYEIRNHGDWVFAREGVVLPECVKKEAIKAMNAVGLDLGSADVCYSVQNNNCVILELNSCSSLGDDNESTTLHNYTNAIKSVLNNTIVNSVAQAVQVPAVAPVLHNNVPAPQNPFPIQTPVHAAPAAAQAAPSPVVNNVNNREYIFDGVTKVKVIKNGNKIRVLGLINGNNKLVEVMEIEGNVSRFWED